MEIAGEIFPPRGVWRINTLSGASQCDSNGHKHEDIQPKQMGSGFAPARRKLFGRRYGRSRGSGRQPPTVTIGFHILIPVSNVSLRPRPSCLRDARAAGPRGNPRRSAMTISRAEVITSVERRRRWSQDEKERLVAASLEPGASVSEVARVAGLHVSQLFRWRKELCKHGEASIAPFVPVAIGPSVPPREVAEAPGTTTAARRRRSQGIIEIDLGSGHRVRVDGDVDGDALRRVLDALVRR